jgi:hypothetical protein
MPPTSTRERLREVHRDQSVDNYVASISVMMVAVGVVTIGLLSSREHHVNPANTQLICNVCGSPWLPCGLLPRSATLSL